MITTEQLTNKRKMVPSISLSSVDDDGVTTKKQKICGSDSIVPDSVKVVAGGAVSSINVLSQPRKKTTTNNKLIFRHTDKGFTIHQADSHIIRELLSRSKYRTSHAMTKHAQLEIGIREDDLERRVSKLRIRDWNTTTSIPSSIGLLQCLKHLDLSNSKNMTRLPIELFDLVNLEVLNLHDSGIIALSHSIARLVHLRELNLSGALKFSSLWDLPEELWNLTNLQKLNLQKTGQFVDQQKPRCIGLSSSIGRLRNLTHLDISHTMLSYLPEEIGDLYSLQVLNLQHTSIVALPTCMMKLQKLKVLNVSHTSLSTLPNGMICNMISLMTLNLQHTSIVSLPLVPITKRTKLKELDLSHTKLTNLPEAIVNLSGLRTLNLKGTNITCFPSSMGGLKNLQDLYLSSTISSLPGELLDLAMTNKLRLHLSDGVLNLGTLQKLNLHMSKIVTLPRGIEKLQTLQEIDLSWTAHLVALPCTFGNMCSLIRLDLGFSAIVSLPSSIGRCESLKYLNLYWTSNLMAIPYEIGDLTNLETLNLQGSNIAFLPPSIRKLQKLYELDISWTAQLTHLPEELGDLNGLTLLNLEGSNVTSIPSSIKRLVLLKSLDLRDTRSLQVHNRHEFLLDLAKSLPLLGSIGEELKKDAPQALKSALALNRARFRMGFGPCPVPTPITSALWPNVISKASRAFDRYPILANLEPIVKNRKDSQQMKDADAIYQLLRECRESLVGILLHRKQTTPIRTLLDRIPMNGMGELAVIRLRKESSARRTASSLPAETILDDSTKTLSDHQDSIDNEAQKPKSLRRIHDRFDDIVKATTVPGYTSQTLCPKWKRLIYCKQKRLLLLAHAAKCPHVGNNTCPVSKHCFTMKQLWKHMRTCQNNHCTVPHCYSSRCILSHYKRCSHVHCPTCGPVNTKLQKNDYKICPL